MPDAFSVPTFVPVGAGLLITVVLVWGLLRVATRAILQLRAQMERDGRLEEGALFARRLHRFVRSSLSVIVALIAGLVMLRAVGIPGTPQISTEVIAWIMGRSRLGDVVSINGKSGLVEAIRLRTIALRSFDGTVHVIPNGVITELSNMTKDFSYAVLDIGVPYDANVDSVVEVMHAVAKELRSDPVHGPNILEPLEVSGIASFGETSVLIRARIKTVPIQQWSVAREFRRRIKVAFEARGIHFPLRQMALRLEDAQRMHAAAAAASEKERPPAT